MSVKGTFGEEPYYPMVGFFFSISFSKVFSKVDSKFKDVSGIEMTLNFSTLVEGGDNGRQFELPEKTSFSDLVLSRGLLTAQSDLTKWCYSWFLNDYTTKLEKKDVYLKLLNEKGSPVMVWQFIQAYPSKMKIGGFNSMATGDAAIMIETITLRYESIKVLK